MYYSLPLVSISLYFTTLSGEIYSANAIKSDLVYQPYIR